MRHWAGERGIELPPPGRYAVAMCFLPMDERRAPSRSGMSSISSRAEGQTLLAWRDVGVDTAGLGAAVIASMPWIAQAIVAASPRSATRTNSSARSDDPEAGLEQRRPARLEERWLTELRHLYMPSFSTRTVVYKGLLLAPQVESFYGRSAQPADRLRLGVGAPGFPSWRLAHSGTASSRYYG